MILLNRAEMSLKSLKNARSGLKTERAFQTRKNANEHDAFT